MLIKVLELRELYPKFDDIGDKLLARKLASVETSIRKHTNCKFQNRLIRTTTNIVDGKINWNTPFLKVDDTIEISDGVNKGLYTVKTVGETIETNEPLYDYPKQLITKIEYPMDVIEGAIDLLDWELLKKGKEKTGIASETISRHAVSYVQRTSDNTIDGYPSELFDFCEKYMNMRT